MALFVAHGCSINPTTTTPSTKNGTLQGRVTEGTPEAETFGKGLANVEVSVLLDGRLKTTRTTVDDPGTPGVDETGFFKIDDLPTSVVLAVTFTLAGYLTGKGTITIQSIAEGTDAGENAMVLLSQPLATIEVSLVLSETPGTVTIDIDPLRFPGALQGIVRDGTVGTDFGKGVAGVDVVAMALGRFVRTKSRDDDPNTKSIDEAGWFSITNLPINVSIPVHYAKDGYVTLTATHTIPAQVAGTAGTGAVNVEQTTSQLTVDVDLVKAVGKFSVIVLGNKGPIANVSLLLDLTGTAVSNTTGATFTGGYNFFAVKTTDSNGEAVFENIPAVAIGSGRIIIQAPDEDGDGTPDYETAVTGDIDLARLVTAATATSNPKLYVQMRGVSGATPTPRVIYTNVQPGGPIKKDENLEFVFSLPMETTASEYTVALTDAAGLPVPVSHSWDATKTKLTIDPSTDLQPAASQTTNNYSMAITARSAQKVSVSDIDYITAGSQTTISFRAVEGASALAAPQVSLWGDPAGIYSGTGIDWNTTTVPISFPPVTGAVGYNVYMKDDKLNTDYVRVGTTQSVTSPTATVIIQSVTIPPQFDAMGTLAGQQPFAYGTEIQVALTVVNPDGVEGAIDSEKILKVKDNTPPSLPTACSTPCLATGVISQTVKPGQSNISTGSSADNSTATLCPLGTQSSCSSAKVLVLRLSGFSEPMGGGGSARILDNLASGAAATGCEGSTENNDGTPTITAGPGWAETTAGQGNRETFVEVSIPAGKSSIGDCVMFNLNGATDSSGVGEIIPSAGGSLPTTAFTVNGEYKTQVAGDVYVYKLK